MTPSDRWQSLPIDLRLALVWCGAVRVDLGGGVAAPDVLAVVRRLKGWIKAIERAYIDEVEAELIDEVGPLESVFRRIDFDRVRVGARGGRS